MEATVHRFDIETSYRYGWSTFTRFPGLLLGVHVLGILLPLVVCVLLEVALNDSFVAELLAMLVVWFVELAALLGMARVALRLRDADSASLDDFTGAVSGVPTAYLASVLWSIVVCVGLVLFFVPGVWIAVRLQFWPIVIAEGERNPVEAMRRSLAITRGHFWRLLGFGVLAQIVMLLGLLALGVGVFVACPVVTQAWADVYRRLASGAAPAGPTAEATATA